MTGSLVPSVPHVIATLTGSFSVKDVVKFIGGFSEEVWGAGEAVDIWLGFRCLSVTSQGLSAPSAMGGGWPAFTPVTG